MQRFINDVVAVGALFSPGSEELSANGGAGVVCLYGNHAGDNVNVTMAIRLAAKDGIEVVTVVANDGHPRKRSGAA